MGFMLIDFPSFVVWSLRSTDFIGDKQVPWVRIASSVLLASNLFPFNQLLANSTLEAMRTQGSPLKTDNV